MSEAMTCADVLQELRRDGDVYITLSDEWVEVYQSDNGDRMCMVSDDVLKPSPAEARLLASALIGADVDLMLAVVNAAVEWQIAAARADEQMDDDTVEAGVQFGRVLAAFHDGNVGLEQAVRAYLVGLSEEGGDGE